MQKPGFEEVDRPELRHSQLLLPKPDATLIFDFVVSPANSYGILGGNFDDAASRLGLHVSYYAACTHYIQAQSCGKCGEYFRLDSCHVIDMASKWREQRLLRHGNKQG